MKNIKISKTFIALTLAGTISFLMAGCSEENEKTDYIYGKLNPTAISIEKTEDEIYDDDKIRLINNKTENLLKNNKNDYADYMYILKVDNLINNVNYIPNEDRYLYVVEGRTLVENFETKKEEENSKLMTEATFKYDNYYVIPSQYEWAERYFKNIEKNTPSIKIYELRDDIGDCYVYYEYKTTFEEEITMPNNIEIEKKLTYKNIKKGDYLKYTALYKSDNQKLIKVAENQTGMGSECENIKREIIGNLTEETFYLIECENEIIKIEDRTDNPSKDIQKVLNYK